MAFTFDIDNRLQAVPLMQRKQGRSHIIDYQTGVTNPGAVCAAVAGGNIFPPSKDKLAFGRYQIRSPEGIRRYWLLMSLAHFIACTGCGETMSFEDGYAFIYSRIQEERLRYIYQCGAKHIRFEDVLALAA